MTIDWLWRVNIDIPHIRFREQYCPYLVMGITELLFYPQVFDNEYMRTGWGYSFRYILGHLYEYLWEVHARRNRALDLKFGFLSSGGGDTPTQPSQLSFMYLGHSHQWKPSLCPPNYKKPVILKLKYKKFTAHWLIFSLLLSNSAFNERDLS